MLIINNVRLCYYPQTLLEECKYVIRKNKIEKLINNDLNLSSSDESDNENDNESDNESDKSLINNFDNNEFSDEFLKDKVVF